jgi:hypothetical protein
MPEKTASSFSGRGVHHYKAFAEVSDGGLADIQLDVQAAIMTVFSDAGLCPERRKQAVYVMIEKVPGIPRSDKLRIIQLLEAYLNQVLGNTKESYWNINMEERTKRVCRQCLASY